MNVLMRFLLFFCVLHFKCIVVEEKRSLGSLDDQMELREKAAQNCRPADLLSEQCVGTERNMRVSFIQV
jgi:hypothetical protein